MASSATAVEILNLVKQYSLYPYYVMLIGGIIGNALNILVFTQLKRFRNNRCVFYLIIESIVGIIFLTVSVISSILRTVYGSDPGDYILVWCRIRFMLFQGMALILFFIICCATCDQFFSTSYRLTMRHMCTLKLAQSIIFATSCIWFLHSMIFSLFLNIQPSVGCIITNSVLNLYATYFFYPVLYGPVQIVIAFSFSLLAFRNVRRIIRRQVPIIRRRLDQQITAMILARVVFFVIFASPYTVYRIYSINSFLSKSNVLQFAILQLFQTTLNSWFSANFASNFYIFVAISSQYRRQVKYVLVKKCWQRWKHCHCIRSNKVNPVNTTSVVSTDELD